MKKVIKTEDIKSNEAINEIDESTSSEISNSSITAEPEAKTPSSVNNYNDTHEKKSFIEGTEKTRVVYEEKVSIVTDVLNDVRNGKAINIDKVQDLSNSLVENVLTHTDTMITLARVKKFDEYTFKHSINVAILTIALGKYLNYPKKELHVLGTGGILHDCGKMKIPNKILNKEGRLTEDEFEIMKNHPSYGAEMLEPYGTLDRKSILMVLQHHEKYSGGGYPTGLPGNRISTFGMMTTIADVYDALTSERVYKKALTPFKGLKMIYIGRGQHFHPNIVEHFILAMGLFPIGSIVRLKNQQMGIVISVNRRNLLYPRVLIIADDKNNMLPEPGIANINPPQRIESNEWTIEEIFEESEVDKPSEIFRKEEECMVEKVLEPSDHNIDIDYYINNLKEFGKKAA
ncbi:MAG: HD-GYP domain-containing protein [Candidatus Schekmanbacteria bacterium]|nr:HD-GYP domain-containing protein [Candidatus Schekmanbacteria bacterium]